MKICLQAINRHSYAQTADNGALKSPTAKTSSTIFFSRLLFFAILFSCAACYGQATKDEFPAWAFGGFERPAGINPVISPTGTTRFFDPMSKDSVAWEANDTFNPAAALYKGKIVVLYRAEDKTGIKIGHRTSRIGYAESTDGFSFTRKSRPVMYPGEDEQKSMEWPGGCEDPRVAVTANGTYVMFYTQWNRKTPRLGVATSKDLQHWTKHGAIFKKHGNDKVFNSSHKSASILTGIKNGKQVVIKIKGKYWMYWGEKAVYAATSTNLIDWTPLTDSDGELKKLITPRKGYFDSKLTECGPPAILTKNGIVLLYNGKNLTGDEGDKRFTANSYCAGQVLFDKSNPEKVLARLDLPFLRPMEAFEKSGQYVDGTVFIEGMVYFHQKWYLYYGCADSRVGVAVFDPQHPASPDPLALNTVTQ